MVGKRGGRGVVRWVVVATEQAAVFRSWVPTSPYSLQVRRRDIFRVGMHAAEVAEKDDCGDDEKDDGADNGKALGKDQYRASVSIGRCGSIL